MGKDKEELELYQIIANIKKLNGETDYNHLRIKWYEALAAAVFGALILKLFFP